MTFIPYNFLFFFCLILGIFISISSTHWIYVWIGIEINLIRFIPLILITKNYYEIERRIKYFLIQALSSSFIICFIFLIIFYSSYFNVIDYIVLILMICFIIKLGLVPFHFWFPDVMKGLNWLMCYLLVSSQKFTPLIIISYMFYFFDSKIIFIGFLRVVVGGLSGISQTNIRLLISYSSISHIGWIALSLRFSFFIIILYFFFYILINFFLFYIFIMYNFSNIKFLNIYSTSYIYYIIIISRIIILSGLPPFIGFLLKFIILYNICLDNIYFFSLILILSSLTRFFFYLVLIFNMIIELSINFYISNIRINFFFFSFFFFSLFFLLYVIFFIL